MLDVVKRFFSKATVDISKDAHQKPAHDVRVATCALFLEMARIDETFTEAEMNLILERKIRFIPRPRRRPACGGR